MPELQTQTHAVPARCFSGERRVLRQLLEAALFEKILDYVYVDHAHRAGCFYFNLGPRAMFCRGRRRGFDRVYLHIETLATTRAGKKQTIHPEDYSELLKHIARSICKDDFSTQKLQKELDQSVYWLNWNTANLEHKTRAKLAYAQLEAALHEGHPYHPCPKARSGFSERDHIRYSSECAKTFTLRWLAIPARALETRLDRAGEDFYRRELGDAQFEVLHTRLENRGVSLKSHSLVPAHPWQWQNFLQNKFREALECGQLIDLGEGTDDYLASQSQRTVINVSRKQAADIKLPLNIVCTSSRRYLHTHSVCTAPWISGWLQQLLDSDHFFQNHPMIALQEYAGMCLAENAGFPVNANECQLGAIWRQSVEQHLQHGEQAIPMTALYSVEANGRAFLEDWIRGYGLHAWLQQLFRVVVLPIWHLLVAHGIALEVHAQNTLLIVRDGWPIKLAVRDFHESLEYVEDFVPRKAWIPDFKAINPIYKNAPVNRYYWMDSLEALRELYMDTLYVFHLSELGKLCEEQWHFPETAFWQLVAGLLQEYREQYPQLTERIQALQHYRKTIQVESLLRKKISSNEELEYHHLVANPFSHIY